MNAKRNYLAVAAGVLLTGAVVASPAAASAYKITSADNGAVYVWNGGKPSSTAPISYYWFYVKDNKADGNSVHGNYSNNGRIGTLTNEAGAGTTSVKWTGSLITALQACVDYGAFEPDNCSGWK